MYELPPGQLRIDIASAVRRSVNAEHRCQIEGAVSAALATAYTGHTYNLRMAFITIHHLSNKWGEETIHFGTERLPDDATYRYHRYRGLQVEHCWCAHESEAGTVIYDPATWQMSDYFRDKWGIQWDFAPPAWWDFEANLPEWVKPWYSTCAATNETLAYIQCLPKLRPTINSRLERALGLLRKAGYGNPPHPFPSWLRAEQPQAILSAA